MPFQPQPCDISTSGDASCCSPAIATTGLCLADSTPIAVLAVSACADCGAAAAAPTVSGWLNLLSGVFTAGPPPAGTEACLGQPQQFQTAQWCDLDAAGEVLAPVLVEYEYDDAGALIGVRTLTPGGQPYTVAGTLGLCPGPVSDVEYTVLCDVQTDGTVTRFLRAYAPNGDGTSTYSDTDFEGAAYTVQGTAGACADCETTQVCVRPSGRVEFISNAANFTDNSTDLDWQWSTSPTGPTWFDMYRVAVYPGWTTVDGGTAEGAAHWVAPHPNGGAFNTGRPNEGPTVPADWYARASFALPANTDPASIRISSTAFNADQLAMEWRLNGGPWQPVNRDHNDPPYALPPTAVPGAQPGVNEVVLHVRETVLNQPAAGLLVHMIAEYDVDATALVLWTRVACDDGAVYYLDDQGVRQDALPEGWSLVPCAAAGAGVDVETWPLCVLDAAGEVIGHVRREAVYDAGGAEAEARYVDAATGAPAVIPAGASVAVCPDAEACQSHQLCDVQRDVAATLPSTGVPTRQWQTLANGVRWMRRGNDGVLPAGWYLADAAAPERFDFDRPVGLRYTVRFSGPTATPLRIPAGWYLDGLNVGQHAWDAATRTISPTASATIAGESTFHTDTVAVRSMTAPVLTGPQTSGQTSQYGQIQAVADVVTPFLRTLCRDAGGTVTMTDTALDGTTVYTVAGTVGACSDADPAPCRSCETLLLCDDGAGDPDVIRGQGVNTGVLANGVVWSARGSATALNSLHSNADGAWWGRVASFPNPQFTVKTWSFDRPSVVEFSVFLLYVPSAPDPDDNSVQLPHGVEVLSLPTGYLYDPVTSRVSVTAAASTDCSRLTDPRVGTSARFRTLGPVSSVAMQYLGIRVANCGVFGSHMIGAFEVTPDDHFLRVICRECDGTVATVTDTRMDGVTAYAVRGTAVDCAAAEAAGPEPVQQQAQPHRYVFTVSGAPAAVDVYGLTSGPVESITITVVNAAGGSITTVDGATALFTGESHTWSALADVGQGSDELVGPLEIAGNPGTVVIITWTERV